ncbi:MAG: UvrD-helicase domain-containing protein, partial [Methanocorpusculum sp.]|nr:UvrD-helicase domain-containing protein [Methanocorpusculum sp.]
EELQRRINIDLKIPAHVATFHSLGLHYLRVLNQSQKVVPIDDNEREKYFLDFLVNHIFPNRAKLDELVEIFNDDQISWLDPKSTTYGPFFLNHYKQYPTFDQYHEAYIEQKIKETPNVVTKVIDIADHKANAASPVTIKGERVKSKGEAIIANFLFCNGIDYAYERIYDELVGDYQAYRPDFSIDIGGERVYIEYFGMSGNSYDNQSYQRIRKIKEDYHHQRRNKFIALEYSANRGYLKTLKSELERLGIQLHPKTPDEIYRILLRQNPLAEFFNLKNFIFSMIDVIASSEKIKTFGEYQQLCQRVIDETPASSERQIKIRQLQWIADFWNYYNGRKHSDPSILRVDYPDMIKLPQGKFDRIPPAELNYDYILVDEYQDISADRFNFLKELIDHSGAKFLAIGDDWQSIFAFQGAKIGYILNFDQYFPNSKRYIISETYRNAQTLIDVAGNFVMRNKSQIRKSLKS